jgi:argininosuccinate lyase
MKLWKGRFEGESHPALDAINRSIDFDIRLWRYDIRGSRAHARMLARVGLLSAEELTRLEWALEATEQEFAEGRFEVRASDEDIHTAIERRVTELAGDAGRKLHTGRSRNDQVSTDMRLFALDAIATVAGEVVGLVDDLTDLAERHLQVIMPAYTHLQRAQPVLFAHHLLAYVEMLRRDEARLVDGARRTRVSPLGAGACAGTSLPIDRAVTAAELGLDEISRNSLDAVSDRDFLMELLSTLAILMIHLSRLGEELVLWSSREFGFCRLHDSVSTGSSMMPQKKNPDGAELMRGKAGRVVGDLVGLLTTMKGLPLAYNKDMQEDKEPVFDAVDTVLLTLKMGRVMVQTLEVDEKATAEAVTPEVFATDLAELLVSTGVPLRTAHETVGALVRFAEQHGTRLDELGPSQLEVFASESGRELDAALLAKLGLVHAVESKTVPGGTASLRVAEAIGEVREWLAARQVPQGPPSS